MKLYPLIVLNSIFSACLFSCGNQKASEEIKAPNTNKPGYIAGFSKACFIVANAAELDSIKKIKQIEVEMPTPRELAQIELITDYIGLPQNFVIYKGNVRNAMSTIINGKRIIVYRKDLLSRIDRISGDEFWSSTFILAHEIGHHLANHFEGGLVSSFESELQADRFAGSVLCRLGASISEATRALKIGFLTAGGDTLIHPKSEIRVEAIADGWNKAMNQLNNAFALPPPPIDDDEDADERIEYTHEDFDIQSIGMTSIKDYIKEKSYDEYDGVITRIQLYPNLRESYSELPFIEKIQVEIENTEGTRFWVNVPDGESMCHGCLRAYLWVLERGRRIRFRAGIWDSGQNLYMFYLKHLPPKSQPKK